MTSLKITKKQIKILIVVFLIIVLAIVSVLLFKKKQPAQITQPKVLETIEEVERETPIIENKFVAEQKTEKSVVSSVARSFAERLGSYSTDNKDENFQSILTLMTEDLRANFKNTTALEKLNTDGHYGISSKALKIETIIADSGDKASSVVSLQRIENINNKETIIYNNLSLDLVKTGNAWLVDGAKWE